MQRVRSTLGLGATPSTAPSRPSSSSASSSASSSSLTSSSEGAPPPATTSPRKKPSLRLFLSRSQSGSSTHLGTSTGNGKPPVIVATAAAVADDAGSALPPSAASSPSPSHSKLFSSPSPRPAPPHTPTTTTTTSTTTAAPAKTGMTSIIALSMQHQWSLLSRPQSWRVSSPLSSPGTLHIADGLHLSPSQQKLQQLHQPQQHQLPESGGGEGSSSPTSSLLSPLQQLQQQLQPQRLFAFAGIPSPLHRVSSYASRSFLSGTGATSPPPPPLAPITPPATASASSPLCAATPAPVTPPPTAAAAAGIAAPPTPTSSLSQRPRLAPLTPSRRPMSIKVDAGPGPSPHTSPYHHDDEEDGSGSEGSRPSASASTHLRFSTSANSLLHQHYHPHQQQQHHFAEDGSVRLGVFDIGIGGLSPSPSENDVSGLLLLSSLSSLTPPSGHHLAGMGVGVWGRERGSSSAASSSISSPRRPKMSQRLSIHTNAMNGGGGGGLGGMVEEGCSNNLVVVGKLGRGNGGTVMKAIYLPTMRSVALKSVQLYNPERRQQMVQELSMLYSNLADIDFEEEEGEGGMVGEGGEEEGGLRTMCKVLSETERAAAKAKEEEREKKGHRRGNSGGDGGGDCTPGRESFASSHDSSWRAGSLGDGSGGSNSGALELSQRASVSSSMGTSGDIRAFVDLDKEKEEKKGVAAAASAAVALPAITTTSNVKPLSPAASPVGRRSPLLPSFSVVAPTGPSSSFTRGKRAVSAPVLPTFTRGRPVPLSQLQRVTPPPRQVISPVAGDDEAEKAGEVKGESPGVPRPASVVVQLPPAVVPEASMRRSKRISFEAPPSLPLCPPDPDMPGSSSSVAPITPCAAPALAQLSPLPSPRPPHSPSMDNPGSSSSSRSPSTPSTPSSIARGKNLGVRAVGSQLRLTINEGAAEAVSQACPFIVSFYDVFADPARGTVNLLVEYMDGGSLEDLVKAGGCDDEAVLENMARCILLGLNYLHERQKIHRDIKPGNLLMNTKGVVKIADFGVSRNLTGTSDLSKTFVGTVGYMSPERIQGHKYNAKADIWSFGLSLLACALGAFPYERQVSSLSYFELVNAVCDEPSPELPPGDERFSPELRDFLRLCLLKDPVERPSAETLLFHPFLQRYAAAGGVQQQGFGTGAASTPRASAGAGVATATIKSLKVKRAELFQIADALAVHYERRRLSVRAGRVASVSASVSASGYMMGGSISGAGGSVSGSAVAPRLPAPPTPPSHAQVPMAYITVGQIRRLAENLQLDEAYVSQTLHSKLQSLVMFPTKEQEHVLRGEGGVEGGAGGGGERMSAAGSDLGGNIQRSLSSSSVSSSVSVSGRPLPPMVMRRASSLMRQSTGGSRASVESEEEEGRRIESQQRLQGVAGTSSGKIPEERGEPYFPPSPTKKKAMTLMMLATINQHAAASSGGGSFSSSNFRDSMDSEAAGRGTKPLVVVPVEEKVQGRRRRVAPGCCIVS